MRSPARRSARSRRARRRRPRPSRARRRCAATRRSRRPAAGARAGGCRRCRRSVQILPPSSTCSSTGSRVVPASSLTTTRSSPAALFSSDDLPTFGRPRIATRRGPPISCLATAETSGSTFMTSSSRSATPRPWMAETGYGSPRPRLHSAAACGLADARRRPCWRRGRRACFDAAQHLDDVLVGRGGADHGVDDEQHGVGQVDRDLGLRGDGGVDALRVGLPAAGVDDA